MEHELRIDTKVIRQPKACRVFLSVIREFLTQPNQHPIHPSQHIWTLVHFCLEHCNSRHEHSSSLLIERGSNSRRPGFCKVSSNSRYAEPLLARRVLVVRDELDETARTRLERLTCGSDDFKVDGSRGVGVQGIDFPGRGLANTDFGFTNAGGFFACRDSVADQARNFEFFRGLKK